jgi:hypothetical protein
VDTFANLQTSIKTVGAGRLRLRLISALLAELDDEWMTSKVYLTLKP